MKYVRVAIFLVAFCYFWMQLASLIYRVIDFGPWNPSIHCDQLTVDAGILTLGGPVFCEFVVENVGGDGLVIENVIPSCGSCLKVTRFSSAPMQRAEKQRLVVTLLPDRLTGQVDKTVAVMSNDRRQPALILHVMAFVRRASTDSPAGNLAETHEASVSQKWVDE